MDYASFTNLDWLVVGVISISLIFGVIRGLLREVLAVVIWVVGYIVSVNGTPELSPMLSGVVTSDLARNTLVFVGLFIVVIFIGMFLQKLTHKGVEAADMTSLDRVGGFVFGIIRGALIMLVALTLCSHQSKITNLQDWQDSKLRHYFEPYMKVANERLSKLSWKNVKGGF